MSSLGFIYSCLSIGDTHANIAIPVVCEHGHCLRPLIHIRDPSACRSLQDYPSPSASSRYVTSDLIGSYDAYYALCTFTGGHDHDFAVLGQRGGVEQGDPCVSTTLR